MKPKEATKEKIDYESRIQRLEKELREYIHGIMESSCEICTGIHIQSQYPSPYKEEISRLKEENERIEKKRESLEFCINEDLQIIEKLKVELAECKEALSQEIMKCTMAEKQAWKNREDAEKWRLANNGNCTVNGHCDWVDKLTSKASSLDSILDRLEVDGKCKTCNGDINLCNRAICHGTGKTTRPVTIEDLKVLIKAWVAATTVPPSKFILPNGEILRMKKEKGE